MALGDALGAGGVRRDHQDQPHQYRLYECDHAAKAVF
jgi:hypothetical protein